MLPLTILSFLIWCWLLTMRGGFWRAGPILPVAMPERAPPVAIVVPARDEAPFIARTIGSLLAQNYPGSFRVIMVDDGSEDGTGAIVRAIGAPRLGEPHLGHPGLNEPRLNEPPPGDRRPCDMGDPHLGDPRLGDPHLGDPRLIVLTGAQRPAGWAGKLWALQQGVTASDVDAPEYYLLTDADIVHDAAHLASLVAMAERHDLDLVSEMVMLSCASMAEKALIPAFVFYFQLLYPFAWVNNPMHKTAAAAGGTILLRRRALIRIGGIEAVRGALIDDVALAGAVKAGGRIFLGHSALARSIRPYPGVSDIWRMITRSAYAQLRFSPVMLVLAMLAMAVVWLVPVAAALFGHGTTRVLGLLTWAMFAAAWQPTLARFHRSFLWGAFPPAIALFYMAATIASAVNHHRGRGVVWKGRAYAGGSP